MKWIDRISHYPLSIQISKSGEMIPVVNNVFLHSSLNPNLESVKFIDDKKDKLDKKNNFLVFGLGFGYHINELSKRLKKIYKKNYRIVVIEPNLNVLNACRDKGFFPEIPQLDVLAAYEVEDLYHLKALVDFMILGPAILVHSESFNLYRDYYQSFMNYRPSDKIGSMASRVEDVGIKRCLACNNPSLALFDFAKKFRETRYLSGHDMVLGAFLSECYEK